MRDRLDEDDDPEVGQVAQGEVDVGAVDLRGEACSDRGVRPGRSTGVARAGSRRIATWSDAGASQVLEDGVRRRVVADPTDDLDAPPAVGGLDGDPRGRPVGDDPIAVAAT